MPPIRFNRINPADIDFGDEEIAFDGDRIVLPTKKRGRPAGVTYRDPDKPARKPTEKGKVTDRSNRVKTQSELLSGPIPLISADLALRFPNQQLDLNASNGRIGIDTETTGLLPRHGDMPWMISMADMRRHSWCTSFPVDVHTRIVHYSETEEFLYLKRICEDPYVDKTFWHRKFDVRMLKVMGIVCRGNILNMGISGHDASLAARVFKTDEFNYKLKTLSHYYKRLSNDDETELKEGTTKLRRRAKKFGWKIFDPDSTSNSKAKDDKSAPDYWLCMYAHLLFPEDLVFAERMKKLAEEYCRKDTLRTVVMDDFYDKEFKKNPDTGRFYAFELMLSPLVEDMEDRGIRTFREIAVAERDHCKEMSATLLAEIRDETKNPVFNPASSEMYSKFLFDKVPQGLGLPPTQTTVGGQHKTGYKDIAHLAWHPFIQKVTKYNAAEKAVSLFFDKYIDVMIWDDEKKIWIVNAEINQNNTRTFRFSMSNPNLQQASNPESSARGANVIQVRNAFGPRDGYDWWLYDYSGQELRLLGGLMKIPAILDAVKHGRDIPTELGNKAWGGKGNSAAISQAIESLELNQREPSAEEVKHFWETIGWYPGKTKDQAVKESIADTVLADHKYEIVYLEKKLNKKTVRTRTKMCLYGKAYGAGWKGVVGLLLCQEEQAKSWLRGLDEAFPEMNKNATAWSSFARQNGYITNAYGRKLNVDPDFAYRATNYRIQGSAAEMMKISMLKCNEYLKSTGLDAHIILTVHDELIFEINRKHAYPWLLRELKRIMEDHEKYVHIPMSVNISRVRERWDIEEEGWEHKIAA